MGEGKQKQQAKGESTTAGRTKGKDVNVSLLIIDYICGIGEPGDRIYGGYQRYSKDYSVCPN